MANFTHEELDDKTIKSSDGSKIGKVTDVFLDYETENPNGCRSRPGCSARRKPSSRWLRSSTTVRTSSCHLTKTRSRKRRTTTRAELSQQQEAELFTYYGVPYAGETVTSVGGPQSEMVEPTQPVGDTAVRDTSGPNTDTAMTRSEERLHVGTESVETGRVRLRKYIVTENVTQTVPVSHEEVRIEREPITEANRDAAMSGAELSEEEAELTLHGERPVAVKETVPVERVGLAKDTLTEEEEVNETLRSEQIDTESVEDTTPR